MDSKIYVLWYMWAGTQYMGFVRVYRGWDGHWHVLEGLTNR